MSTMASSTSTSKSGGDKEKGSNEGSLNNNDYHSLFKKLDINRSGEITLQDFKKALKDLKHPLSESPEMIKKIFDSFDSNQDKVIDFNDFKLYLTTTDDQILKGFNKIDQDNDGRLNKADFVHYLKKTLNLSPSDSKIDLIFKQIDYKNDGYVTYDEFRDFYY